MDDTGSEHRLDLATDQPQPSPERLVLVRNPYVSALLGAAILVVVGAYIISSRTPATPTGGSATFFGGNGSFLDPLGTTQGPVSQSVPSIVQQSPPYSYTLPTPQTTTADATTSENGDFNYDAFINLLTNENATVSANAPTPDLGSAYAFIPTGLVSVQTPQTRSAQQQALYDYGNDLGSSVQSFEAEHSNESQILFDQAQDRTDSDKAAAVGALAQALSDLGTHILAMDNVPQEAVADNTALGQAYQALGTKLALVPQAQGDQAFITAVENYDTIAQQFVKTYVSVADLFVTYGVTFSPADAGSVFTFTNTSL